MPTILSTEKLIFYRLKNTFVGYYCISEYCRNMLP
jgi:hypothetical protein